MIGLIKALGRIIDAVSDPMVASFSDKSGHRDGRRIPFLRRYAVAFALFVSLPFAVLSILLTAVAGGIFTLISVAIYAMYRKKEILSVIRGEAKGPQNDIKGRILRTEGEYYEQGENEPNIKNPLITAIREQLEHRALRGIAESFGCELDLPATIARRDDICQIRFVRR